MIGSAFILTPTGWACSNDVILDIHKQSLRDPVTGKTLSVKQTQVLTVNRPFGKLVLGEKVEVVIKPDEEGEKKAFIGEVKSIIKNMAILNIFAKSERIKEILSNITFD